MRLKMTVDIQRLLGSLTIALAALALVGFGAARRPPAGRAARPRRRLAARSR